MPWACCPSGPPRGLGAARGRLLGLLHGSYGDDGCQVTVVFDAARAPPGAEVSGVPVSSLRNCEQGIRQPAWDVLLRLSPAMKCSADVLGECVEGLPPLPAETTKRR